MATRSSLIAPLQAFYSKALIAGAGGQTKEKFEEGPDEAFVCIYVHWDGYPSARLPILEKNFSDRDGLIELFSHGDLSSLKDCPWIDDDQVYDSDKMFEDLVCRPDTLYPAAFGAGQEYAYIFSESESKWLVFDFHAELKAANGNEHLVRQAFLSLARSV